MKLPSLLGLTIGFALLAGIFWLIERRYAALPSQPRWRRDSRTDLAYWFFTPFVSKTVTRLAIIAALLLLALAARVPLDAAHVRAFATSPSRIGRQPLAFQILELLLISDLLAYGMHRAFHRG